MKKIIIPLIALFSMFSLTSCKKKSETRTKVTTKETTKKATTKKTTTKMTTTEYKYPIYIHLDFGDYNDYYVDEKYKNTQEVYEITKDCFPFDLVWSLRYFKGWAYNGELIFDENGNKVKNIEPDYYMTFDVVFEPHEELKMFDYSLGMSDDEFDI